MLLSVPGASLSLPGSCIASFLPRWRAWQGRWGFRNPSVWKVRGAASGGAVSAATPVSDARPLVAALLSRRLPKEEGNKAQPWQHPACFVNAETGTPGIVDSSVPSPGAVTAILVRFHPTESQPQPDGATELRDSERQNGIKPSMRQSATKRDGSDWPSRIILIVAGFRSPCSLSLDVCGSQTFALEQTTTQGAKSGTA